DAGRPGGRVVVQRPRNYVAVAMFRFAGGGPGGGRALWSHGIHGCATDARGWNPYGAWRDLEGYRLDGIRRCSADGCRGPWDRLDRCIWTRRAGGGRTVRRQVKGSAGVCCCMPLACNRVPRSRLSSRPACCDSRPHESATLRVSPYSSLPILLSYCIPI